MGCRHNLLEKANHTNPIHVTEFPANTTSFDDPSE